MTIFRIFSKISAYAKVHVAEMVTFWRHIRVLQGVLGVILGNVRSRRIRVLQDFCSLSNTDYGMPCFSVDVPRVGKNRPASGVKVASSA